MQVFDTFWHFIGDFLTSWIRILEVFYNAGTRIAITTFTSARFKKNFFLMPGAKA